MEMESGFLPKGEESEANEWRIRTYIGEQENEREVLQRWQLIGDESNRFSTFSKIRLVLVTDSQVRSSASFSPPGWTSVTERGRTFSRWFGSVYLLWLGYSDGKLFHFKNDDVNGQINRRLLVKGKKLKLPPRLPPVRSETCKKLLFYVRKYPSHTFCLIF